ncbi:cytochrome P450 [Hydrococcus rivularis NIES-593]|uniref:Cytochrome P450 n=1 Tax=Hydrococcus rivularis NIES-593 TaxID=1921803 RepID=A0A1U7H9P4_9CYAN|nr:cytochrome P450 [Hydrococcus rivularis]OKH20261.1 cytochrome P450 [Hydrococcus rivularis NIES-593]
MLKTKSQQTEPENLATLPPRPKTPELLRMLNLIFRPVDYMDNYGKRYGDFFTVGSEKNPFVYVSNPQAIQEIFTGDPYRFDTRMRGGFIYLLLGANSLLSLDGARHQRERKLLMPPFHGDRLRAYGHLICEITRQVTESWQVGKSFQVRSYMQEITLRVILQAVFGLQQGERCDRLRQLIGSMLDSISSPLSSTTMFFPALRKDWGNWSPWGRFLRQQERVDHLLFDEIRERRERGNLDGEDILTLLMSARDEEGKPMTDQELRDELMTLLFAGHETTASALSWALYWIQYLPEVQEKLRSELATLPEEADPSEIVRLPYLTAVCQETLRIYPIALAAFPRILKAPLELMGYQFKAGTMLAPCIYLTHHREDLYPEPKHFKPERFLERQYSPFEYFPFGGGNRRCIGMALAMMEMKLVLATILSDYQLALTSNRPVKPVRRGLTIAAPGSLRMVVTSIN